MKRKQIAALTMTALAALVLCAMPTPPRRTQEETVAVFGALSEEVQVELLAGAIALLTEPEDGYAVRLTVGGVLLNRLRSDAYGDALWEVTAPLLDAAPETIPETSDAGALRAARDALSGHMPVPGATLFGKGEAPQGMEAVVFGGYWFGRG